MREKLKMGAHVTVTSRLWDEKRKAYVGRELVERGRVEALTDTHVTLRMKPMRLPGFGACPTTTVISLASIQEVS